LRVAGCVGFLCSWLICVHSQLCRAAPTDCGATSHVTRQQLLGAWQLVRIEYSGPSGPLADPFYQTDSTGLIVYDPSGWMSVHIAAPHRRAWDVPASRSSSSSAEDAPLKAAAFDTYYAYYGTWDLDEAASVVTHHVKSALIPAETGLDYSQQAALEGERLIFTVCTGNRSEQRIRRKIWQRIPQVVK
jgi:hypothetical protein